MTINERVSPETLDKIIEAADDFITALAVTTEDDSTNMRQLLDGVKALNATPEIVKQMCEIFKAMARELQQYRADAEPVAWVMKDDLADADIIFTPAYTSFSDAMTKTVGKLIPLYAAPQVTSVPDERPSLNNGIIGFDEGWNACRAAMLQGAEPVSQPYTLPANVIDALGKALQAMSFMGDTLNALDAVCEEDVEYVTPAFEAVREVLEFAEPAQGWIPCGERMPEFYFSVLVTDEHEDMVIALPVYLDAGDRCAFQLSNGDIFIATHWMPLPAAPKQEAE